MTALKLFNALAPLVGPGAQIQFDRRDLCIYTTRVAIDVAAYFRIEARPIPCRVFLCNSQFSRHIDEGDPDINKHAAADGSHSVGVGFGGPDRDKWDGHLITAADGVFADFSIRQAERADHGIVTGDAIIGPLPSVGDVWGCQEQSSGTRVEYQLIENNKYLNAPDWKNRKRRNALVGSLIRLIKQQQQNAFLSTSSASTSTLERQRLLRTRTAL